MLYWPVELPCGSLLNIVASEPDSNGVHLLEYST